MGLFEVTMPAEVSARKEVFLWHPPTVTLLRALSLAHARRARGDGGVSCQTNVSGVSHAPELSRAGKAAQRPVGVRGCGPLERGEYG